MADKAVYFFSRGVEIDEVARAKFLTAQSKPLCRRRVSPVPIVARYGKPVLASWSTLAFRAVFPPLGKA